MEDIRIAGGPHNHSGRVEVLHDGYWGLVCADDWDRKDANVICGQLGYPTGNIFSDASLYRPKHPMPLWLSNINCTGMETNLNDCHFDMWSVLACNNLANIICADAGI